MYKQIISKKTIITFNKIKEFLFKKGFIIKKKSNSKLLNDEKHLDSILFDGSQKADKIASKKIKEIKQLIGF